MARRTGPFQIEDVAAGSSANAGNYGLLEFVSAGHADADSFLQFVFNDTDARVLTAWRAFPSDGGLPQFDLTTKALTDSGILAADVVTLGGSQVLTNKNLTTPTISSFTNANHDHTNSAGGGTLNASVIAAGTVATARLGSGSASSSTYLRGDQTWATPGGVSWSVQTSGSTAMAANNGYIANAAGALTYSLPASAAVGDLIWLTSIGAGGFIITQGASQTIKFGTQNTAAGAGGQLVAAGAGNTVLLLCTVANTNFMVIASVGNTFGII